MSVIELFTSSMGLMTHKKLTALTRAYPDLAFFLRHTTLNPHPRVLGYDREVAQLFAERADPQTIKNVLQDAKDFFSDKVQNWYWLAVESGRFPTKPTDEDLVVTEASAHHYCVWVVAMLSEVRSTAIALGKL